MLRCSFGPHTKTMKKKENVSHLPIACKKKIRFRVIVHAEIRQKPGNPAPKASDFRILYEGKNLRLHNALFCPKG